METFCRCKNNENSNIDIPKDFHDIPWTKNDKEFMTFESKYKRNPIIWPLIRITKEGSDYRLITIAGDYNTEISFKADLCIHTSEKRYPWNPTKLH